MFSRTFRFAVSVVAAAVVLALLPFGDSAFAATRTTQKKTPSSTAKKTPSNPKSDPDKSADEPKPETKPNEPEEKLAPEAKKERAPNATLEPSDLAEFNFLSPRTQRLIEAALALTRQGLTYTYGSADPARGGMDCSGTIFHLLRSQGFGDVPRDSAGQYVWTRKAGGFEAVIGTSADSFEFDALRPGDLLFWSGTYTVAREFPVTHVMLYLGREKKTKQRVMFGASDGRSYRGIQRWGVSVFDFKMPKADPSRTTTPNFLGYAPIPGIRNNADVAATLAPAPAADLISKSETPKSAEPDSSPKKSASTAGMQKSSASKNKGTSAKKPKAR